MELINIEFNVPFYPNTLDNTHCFQAALRMVLKYFIPKIDYKWGELDQLTAKKEGLWTWPLAGLVRLQHMGFTIMDIETFDYERFIKECDEYLYEFYGEKVGIAQIQNSDIQHEREISKEFIKRISIQKRLPDIYDIKNLMKEGFLVICNINSHILNKKEGYSGHFVVIKGCSNNKLILHDPGLPPLKNRIVSINTFEHAWKYPNKNAKNIIALRYTY